MSCSTDYCYHNAKFYRFSSEARTYEEAKEACRRNAGRIAVVKHAATWRALSECCGGSGDSTGATFYWMGLTRCSNWFNRQFRWEGEGTCRPLDTLRVNVPRFRTEDCEAILVNPAALDTHGYPRAMHKACRHPEHYICERLETLDQPQQQPGLIPASETPKTLTTTYYDHDHLISTVSSKDVGQSDNFSSLAPYFLMLPVVVCLLVYLLMKACEWWRNRKGKGFRRRRSQNLSVSSGVQLLTPSSGRSRSATMQPEQHYEVPPPEDNVYEEVMFLETTTPANRVQSELYSDSSFDDDDDYDHLKSEIQQHESGNENSDQTVVSKSVSAEDERSDDDYDTLLTPPITPQHATMQWKNVPPNVYVNSTPS